MFKLLMNAVLAAGVWGSAVPAFAGSEAVVTCRFQITDTFVVEAWNIPQTAHYSMELSIEEINGNKTVLKRWIADRQRNTHEDTFLAGNKRDTMTIKKHNDVSVGTNSLSNEWVCEYH